MKIRLLKTALSSPIDPSLSTPKEEVFVIVMKRLTIFGNPKVNQVIDIFHACLKAKTSLVSTEIIQKRKALID
jgi:hypothetical protein